MHNPGRNSGAKTDQVEGNPERGKEVQIEFQDKPH